MSHLEGGDVPEIDVSALITEQKNLRRLTHETLAKCEDDFGRRLAFNTVVAAVMSLINQVIKFEDDSPQAHAVVREALTIAVLSMSPITPHACHELWERLGLGALEDAEWLRADESAVKKTSIELVVQVDGRMRGKVEVAPDAREDEAVAAAQEIENVEKFLMDKTIRKIIYVPNKILNFVVG